MANPVNEINVVRFVPKDHRHMMPFQKGNGVTLAGWQFRIKSCKQDGTLTLQCVGHIPGQVGPPKATPSRIMANDNPPPPVPPKPVKPLPDGETAFEVTWEMYGNNLPCPDCGQPLQTGIHIRCRVNLVCKVCGNRYDDDRHHHETCGVMLWPKRLL